MKKVILISLFIPIFLYGQKVKLSVETNENNVTIFNIQNLSKDTIRFSPFLINNNVISIRKDSSIIVLRGAWKDFHPNMLPKILPKSSFKLKVKLQNTFQKYKLNEGIYFVTWHFENYDTLTFTYNHKKPKINVENIKPKLSLNLSYFDKNLLYFNIRNNKLFENDTTKIRPQYPALNEKNKILIEDEDGKVYSFINTKNTSFKRVYTLEIASNIDSITRASIIERNGETWSIEPIILFQHLKLPKNKKYTLVWQVDEYYSEPLEYEYK